jgi:hypothetical protein
VMIARLSPPVSGSSDAASGRECREALRLR